MKKSYGEGSATHTGPESCGAARKGSDEALTGECMGRVFSRVRNSLRDADAVRRSGRPHRVHRYREVPQSPARSETPCTYVGASLGNREIPRPPRARVALGRIGKSKDRRLPSVIPILCAAWAPSLKARTGCGSAVSPDP